MSHQTSTHLNSPKAISIMLALFAAASLLLSACSIIDFTTSTKSITPSGVIVTEKRDVSGFTGINMRTIGTVSITQGDSESLEIKGSDNIVPLVKTSVRGGVLNIEMDRDISLHSANTQDLLTFTITVKDLSSLIVSGLGVVDMPALTTNKLNLEMSGAGAITLSSVAAQSVTLNLSGLGKIEVSGKADKESITLSGAGEVKTGGLEVKTADVHISGLGSATIWAVDELSGSISGSGDVNYYGSPKVSTNSTGLGSFKSLGSK